MLYIVKTLYPGKKAHIYAVSWSTKKQTGIILSSTETEYVALAITMTEVIWIKGLLEDFNIYSVNPIIVYEVCYSFVEQVGTPSA